MITDVPKNPRRKRYEYRGSVKHPEKNYMRTVAPKKTRTNYVRTDAPNLPPPPEKNDMRTGASTKKTPKKSYMRTDAARKHRKNYIRRGVPATKIPNKTI
jgi:hypothetical protein